MDVIAGDILALAIITVIGFATHGETDTSFVPRMLTTFIPLVVSWFLIAPWLGLFDAQITSDPKQFWRPPLAMLLASPMSAILRAAMLNAVLTEFVVMAKMRHDWLKLHYEISQYASTRVYQNKGQHYKSTETYHIANYDGKVSRDS